MNILITGGTGFVGRNLLEKISNKNWNAYVILTKFEDGKDINKIKGVKTIDSEYIFCELGKNKTEVDFPKFDCCVNLAAAGVTKKEKLKNLINANVAYTSKVLEFCKKKEINRIIHIGSCFEYGEVKRPNLIKESNKIDPFSLYGATKASSSIIAKTYAKNNNLSLTLFRPFGIFGRYESQRRLVPQVMKSILLNKPLKLTKGNQVRDFLFVDDLVEAIIIAIKEKGNLKGTYNVCSAKGITVRNFVELICNTLGGNHRLLNFGSLPSRKEEPEWIVGDNSKLVNDTNWTPNYSLKEGIIESYKWFKESIRSGKNE